jgi:integrase/recombinase XerD
VFRSGFETAVKVAKIDDFHFHDTRHHFASWFVMQGGRVEALQKILGHASLAMTMRYAHLAPDYLRSEVTKTERPGAQPTETLAQEIAQEPTVTGSLSAK